MKHAATRWWMVAATGAGLVVGAASAAHGAARTATNPTAPDTGRIVGAVVDEETGDPVADAHVQVIDLRRETLTAADGSFLLADIPEGRHRVRVARLGYRDATRIVTVGAGASAEVRIELAATAIMGEELLVTGTIGEQGRHESLRPANVLSAEKLARELDGTVAGTLEDQAGIATMSMGPATARPVIRGLSGDRILMLEDGERVGDLSSSSPDHAVATDPLSAKRIEVIRGPAALLYGSNALGGVVNVIRREIPETRPESPTGAASVHGKSVDRSVAGEGSVVGAVGPIALRAEVSGRRGADLRTPIGTLDNTWAESGTLGGGASWVGDWGHAGAAARLYRSAYGLPGGFTGAHPDGVRIDMERQAVKATIDRSSGFGPFSSVSLDGTYTRYHHRETETGGVLGTEMGLLTASSDVLARHESLGPFAEGAVGVRAEWRDFAAGGALRTPPGREHSLAAFVLEEIALDPVRLQFGGRYDWHRVVPLDTATAVDIGRVRPRTFGALSGSLGALYDLADGVALGVSVARAFRTPGIGELYSEGPHLAAYSVEVGNPDLDVEVGLGWDGFLRITRAGLEAEIAGFRNHIDNYIFPRNTGRTSDRDLPVYQHSNADALLSGLEAELRWRLHPHVTLEGAASYVRGTNTRTDRPLPLIPPLNGTLGLRYQGKAVTAGLGWKAVARQDRVGEFETPTDGHHLLDANVGYRWTALDRVHTITLRVDNLTDAEYRSHLSRVKSIMPEPGRSASLLYRIYF